MLMILARLGRSESFWAVVKVRSPHTGREVSYIIRDRDRACGKARGWRKERDPTSALHGDCEHPPGSRLPRGARLSLTLLGRERRRPPGQPSYGRDKLAHKRLGLDSHEHLAIQRPPPAPLPVGHRGAAGEAALQLHLDSRRPPCEQARADEVHDGHLLKE